MKQLSADQTQSIFGLCTGALPSAVAIIRISGKASRSIFEKNFVFRGTETEGFRRGMYFGDFVDNDGKLIDEIVALGFEGPNSFTGEDILELQCHGSVAVVEAIERILTSQGIRAASRGEFSYRAWSNGRLPLEKLNELGDLFKAKSESDLTRIYSRKEKTLERDLAKLRENLTRILAVLDTAIDFSDEYSNVAGSAIPMISQVIQDIQAITHRYSSFYAGGKEPYLVLAGRPNAGKSSLFNLLLGRYRAIVHEKAGTTRDVIEETISLNGNRWKIVDTAGVRDVRDGAERDGIALGREYLANADFWVLVVDGTGGLKDEDSRLLKDFGHIPHLVFWNKSDLSEWKEVAGIPVVPGSLKSSVGASKLLSEIERSTKGLDKAVSEPLPTLTEAARLAGVVNQLSELKNLLSQGASPEYPAELGRQILGSLASIVGEVDQEMVLDRVFNDFCVGK